MTARSYGNGAWRGELHLVLLQDKRGPAVKAGRSLWAVAKPLVYMTHAGDTITVPAGMVTDLASIPRWAWSLLPPDGPWTLASVFHDLLYRTQGTGDRLAMTVREFIGRGRAYSRAEADQILLQAMEDLKVSWIQRWAIWAAVRIGGAAGWGN